MAAQANDGVAFWKRWIQLQVEHNIDHMASVSIKNFHFPGLNYVCFEFSPTQTIRLYIVDPSERLDTREVQIHNHLYDSQILVLHGWVKNRVYKIDHEAPEAERYNAFHLTSALEPSNAERRIKLDFLRRVGLKTVDEIHLAPGQSHFQKHTEIHNVENDPSRMTAFMVFEFPTVKKRSTLFSRRELGDTIPTPGCYLRYEPEELRALVQGMLAQMP